MTALIECRNVSKRFGGVSALSNISLTVFTGDTFGIVGPNGAGKTSLFNIICGSIPADQGQVLFRGRSITGLGPGKICKIGMARTYQAPRPFRELTVRQNVLLGMHYGRNGIPTQAGTPSDPQELLKFLGLADKRDRPAGSLTLVERKRLEIARALATDPELILLDEPFAGLNPVESAAFMEVVRELPLRGITVILIEHILKVVVGLCSKVLVVNHGSEVCTGTPEQVFQDRRLQGIYLGVGSVAGQNS